MRHFLVRIHNKVSRIMAALSYHICIWLYYNRNIELKILHAQLFELQNWDYWNIGKTR